jgi:membrane-associated PAP2 superfamily phosphatase
MKHPLLLQSGMLATKLELELKLQGVEHFLYGNNFVDVVLWAVHLGVFFVMITRCNSSD